MSGFVGMRGNSESPFSAVIMPVEMKNIILIAVRVIVFNEMGQIKRNLAINSLLAGLIIKINHKKHI